MTDEDPAGHAGRGRGRRDWTESGYRALVRIVFPTSFVRLYGADLLEVFRDQCAAARARGRVAWLATVFGVYLRSLAVAVREHWEGDQQRTVPSRRAARRRLMFWQDVRFAVRSFRSSPAFALTVVALIALGVGAVTAVFSVVDGVLLRPLPYPQADRLVLFSQGAHSVPKFQDWREQASSFERVVAARSDTVPLLSADGLPQEVTVARVSAGFLEAFGAAPMFGQLLSGTDLGSSTSLGVITHRYWRDQMGADQAVVGSSLVVDDVAVEIVGVLDPRFELPSALVSRSTAVLLPLDEDDPFAAQRNIHLLQVAGRLADGVSHTAAQSELDAIAERLAAVHPDFEQDRSGQPYATPLEPLRDATVGSVGGTLYLLLGAVGLLLLIACTNVASLWLARGITREREFGLRSALGAGWRRLVTQLITESVLLALVGGVLGAGLAYGAIRIFHLWRPPELPRAVDVSVDLRVLIISLLLSLFTGIVLGALPALRAARSAAGTLQVARSTSGRSSRRLRHVFVVAQIAMALVLLAGAGLLFQSFLRLTAVELGFDDKHLTVVRLERGGYDQEDFQGRVAFVRDLLERVRALPGVEGAAASWIVPFAETGGSRCCWSFSGRRADQPEEEGVRVHVQPVTADYVQVLGLPLLKGRHLRDTDTGSPNSALISRSLAEELFAGREVVGQGLLSARGEYQIVGVVDDLKQWGLDQDPGNQIYVSYYDQGAGLPSLSFVVRSSLPSERMAPLLRDAVWAIDPRQPVRELVSMGELVSRSVAPPRSLSLLWGAFAAVSLILAAAGVYGSLLYTVGQRRREMGIRLALGARRAEVLELVVRQGILWAGAGIGLGAALAFWLGRLMDGLLFEIEGRDPLTLAAVSLTLGAVAALACWLPARRAAATDPVDTLRAE